MADDVAMADPHHRSSPAWRSPTTVTGRPRRVRGRQPAGQGRPDRLRPARRLRARARRPVRAVRLLLRGVPPDPPGGAADCRASTASARAPTPWPRPPTPRRSTSATTSGCRPAGRNSYLLPTDDGRVVINTGMGFEGPLHRRAFDAVDPSPTRAVLLTQGHYDHVGGVDVLRDADSDVVAQANFTMWRDDNERLEAFRSRNSAFAFIDAILAAMEYARSVGRRRRPAGPAGADRRGRRPARARPSAAATWCSSPRRAARPSTRWWCGCPRAAPCSPATCSARCSATCPNLVTIRGDRYRDALTYIDSLDVVAELAPERLVTGHFDPDRGRRPHRRGGRRAAGGDAVGARPHRRRA